MLAAIIFHLLIAVAMPDGQVEVLQLNTEFHGQAACEDAKAAFIAEYQQAPFLLHGGKPVVLHCQAPGKSA